MITFFEFLDNTRYCLARDIVDCARSQGYDAPISTDGRVHPGTICNNVMRGIIKDGGLRRKFNITPSSLVEVRAYSAKGNDIFITELIRNEFIKPNLAASGHVDLYSLEACRAVLSVLLNSDIFIDVEESDVRIISYHVEKKEKSVEKKKFRPKVSLFKK